MLLYFRHFHHYKYALEAFHTLALVELIAPPHVKQQIVWSRVVNSRGGVGNNIPVDLHMEHLNRLLQSHIDQSSTQECGITLSTSFREWNTSHQMQ